MGGHFWAGWTHSPLPIPELDHVWEFGVGSVLESGRKPPLIRPFLCPSSKVTRPHPEDHRALSADHCTVWARTCREVLVTGLGFYNITGDKDVQPRPAHKRGPSAFLWTCRIDAFLHGPQAAGKASVVLHLNPKMHHIFLLLAGKREREKWVEGDRKRGKESVGGRVSVNERC